MALYQRRRPSPIKILPDRVRRDDSSTTTPPKESPDGPDSPDDISKKETDSPSSTSTSFASSISQTTAEKTDKEEKIGSTASNTTAETTDKDVKIGSTTSTTTAATQSSAVPSSPTSSAAPTSTAEPAASASPQTSSPTTATSTSVKSATTISLNTGTSAPAAQITSGSSAAVIVSTTSGTSIRITQVTSQTTGSTSLPSPTIKATSTITSVTPAQSELEGEEPTRPPQKATKQEGGAIMSKGAEAALITCAVLGFVALLIGLFLFIKRRRRRRNELGMRHAEDAFNPSNFGSLHAPETAHLGFESSAAPHMTQSSSSSNSASLFGGAHYQRPETVSTDEARSRIPPPQPTPNPFADPPRNKAYDQLRGRPRSTTLTDRGSWIKNPFKDPESDRFDPFGELQEKARRERRKYVEEVRREEEERRRREREQEFLEKERMGLGVPDQARKGSGVTVEGLGVLDRSGSGRYR